MDNIAQLGIKVDSTDIKKATTELNNLSTASGKTEKTTNSLVGGFSKIQAGAIAAAAGITAMAKAGIDYNAQMEKLTNGLTTLNVLTSKNVDSNGKALSQEQKYNLARLESIETMKKLNAVNLETPHTLDQTVQIYKSMYTSMKTVGVSSEQMIDLTKKLSIAAGSSGIEFQQLLAGIDGLATGTVEASSELGRFLKSMGLGNEVLKNSTNIYETLNNKFKDVKGIMGYDEAVSNLTNSFDQLTGALVAPFFDDVKDGITGLSGMFNELTNSVTLFYDKFKSISELTSREQLNKRAVEVSERIQQIQEDLKDPSWFQSSGKLNAELRAANLELLAINQSFIDMDKSSASTLVAADKIVETKEETKKLTSTVKDNSKAIQDNSLYLEALSSAYTEMAQSGLSEYDNALVAIAEKTQKWIEAGVNVNDVLAVQKQLVEELNIQQALSSASDELSFLERKAQLMTDEYEKSKLLLEIKYAQSMIDIQGSDKPLEDKQNLIDKETELYNLTKERIELDRNTEFQDTIKTFQEDALERQIALNESMYEFGDSFDGIAKHISTASKAIINMNTIAIKGKKEESKLNEKYTKEFLKYSNDELKTKELVGQYEKDNSQLKQQQQDAEIAGYANLAGAMASAFEAGSAGALAFTTLQAALGIVSSWTAIAQAWALPFPENLPAVAMVASAVMPIIGQLSAMGGGGGSSSGGGGSKKPSQFDIKEQKLEDMYTPMTDRLDRQIELLESIDKQGSASALGLQAAKIGFERDYALAVNKINSTLPTDTKGFTRNFNSQIAGAESRLGFNIADVYKIFKSGWDSSEDRIYTDFKSLSKDSNMIDVISYYFETNDKAIAKLFGGENKLNLAANEIQSVIGDFTQGIVDSLDDMKDASNSFKDIFDEITGTFYYENKRLVQAFTDVAKITGDNSFSTYLKNNIDQIDMLRETFTDAVMETLLSQDPKDMAEQVKVLEELEAKTGMVFANGTRDALDFMESIELVGEALATSNNNIKDFVDSFKSEDQLAKDFASSMGLDLATTWEELALKLKELSSDLLGLTDEDLEFLEKNKAYIESMAELEEENRKKALEGQKALTQEQLNVTNEALSNIKSSVSTISSVLNNLKSTIDKLRESSDTTNTYTLDKFSQSMAKTQELMKGKDYKAIQDSLQETIGYSSALSDSKNFALSRDMQYAQLVAANQFEAMDLTLTDELDYLKMIETNTKDTVTTLTDTLKRLETSITSSQDGQSKALEAMQGMQVSITLNEGISDFDRLIQAEKDKQSNAKSDIAGLKIGYDEKVADKGFIANAQSLVTSLGTDKTKITAANAGQYYDDYQALATKLGLGKDVTKAELAKAASTYLATQSQISTAIQGKQDLVNAGDAKIADLLKQKNDAIYEAQQRAKYNEYIKLDPPYATADVTEPSTTPTTPVVTPPPVVAPPAVNPLLVGMEKVLADSQLNKTKDASKDIITAKEAVASAGISATSLKNIKKALGLGENITEKEMINNVIPYLKANPTLSFAVGTTNVPYDMFAQIHKNEIITPANFSNGLRNGDLIMGETSSIVSAINNMNMNISNRVSNLESGLNGIMSNQGSQIKIMNDTYDVNNGTLTSLQTIEKVI